MDWEWLLCLLGFALFNDWPWLLVVVGVSWLLSWGHWPASPWWMVVELAAALAAEGILAALKPRRALARLASGTALEGAALGGFVLLWGTFSGLALWQGALGFDAVSRLHRLMVTAGRRAVLRGVRVVLGVVLLVLYHARVWM